PAAPVRPETLAVVREALDALVVMLSPFAPHTAEELWQMLGHGDSLTRTAWPTFDPHVARADEVVVPVQVNGKVRARVTVPAAMRRVVVPGVTDRTTACHLDTTLTQPVRSEFNGSGKYEIESAGTGVDGLLTGEFTAVSITPASINANQLASRYAITIVARVEL